MHILIRTAWAGLAFFSLGTGAPALAEESAETGVEASAEPGWQVIAPENLMLVETSKGIVTIELNPDFAPGHVERMRELAAAGAYDDKHFYRVIDGFVAQGGLEDEDEIAEWGPIRNENDRPFGGDGFVPLGNADLFAPEVGHTSGFPVGRDEMLDQEWLLHCPGAVAMARDNDPDSGGTEFYIVLDAQRYLDRNLTVFGRVIDGMQHVQAFARGERAVESGVIQAPATGEAMSRVTIASDLAEDQRPVWQTMTSAGQPFDDFKTSKRVRSEAFFYHKPPEVLDICSFETPSRRVDAPSHDD
jgi:peptidylprolyl isomerase